MTSNPVLHPYPVKGPNTPRWIQVPLTPPSVNHYLQVNRNGGRRLTKDAQAFKDAVCILARSQAAPTDWKRYGVKIVYVLGERTRIDIDNAPKLVLDGLQASGLISNDSQVFELIQQKIRTHDRAKVFTDIWLWNYGGSEWMD